MWPFKTAPEKWLKNFDPQSFTWLAVSLSSQQYLDFVPNVQLEGHAPQGIMRAAWGLKGKEARWDIWSGSAHQKGVQGVASEQFFAPFFIYTHLACKSALEKLQQNALQPTSGVTTPEISQEGKALQWLQATLVVLSKAVESCSKESGKLLQSTIFIGQQHDGPVLLRARVLSLDITVAFDVDGTLGVVVFDDKNLGVGSAKVPALEARFRALKAPVLDELIRIVNLVVNTMEKRLS
jgi:hypothetical protein